MLHIPMRVHATCRTSGGFVPILRSGPREVTWETDWFYVKPGGVLVGPYTKYDKAVADAFRKCGNTAGEVACGN